MCIYDNCLGGYVYIKYATESPKTGASNKLLVYITCRDAGHLFKFKHNMSRGSFSWHILPTYIVVRRSVGLPAAIAIVTIKSVKELCLQAAGLLAKSLNDLSNVDTQTMIGVVTACAGCP